MSIVIVHDEMGVYLGNCMGLGFWSLLDSAGQLAACTFKSEGEAADHIRSWDAENDPTAYKFVTTAAPDSYASIAELKAAGLSEMLGDMEADALRWAEPAGSA